MSDKTAVILLQMGGPDSIEAVKPFLFNLFSDRDIIRLGPMFLQPFLAWRISRKRAAMVEGQYEQIGGKSPIRELTEAQAQALEDKLGDRFRCFIGMRYSRPSIVDALATARREDISQVLLLPLYPQYSRATTGSSFNEVCRVLRESPVKFHIWRIESFYNHPLYITALARSIKESFHHFSAAKMPVLLFSAHSLPRSLIEQGDPYLGQIRETVRLVMEHFPGIEYYISFQSRPGRRVKWLGPETETVIRDLASKGLKDLLVVPISFVSDHIETLYEIDIQYAGLARLLGIDNWNRASALNASPAFIDCLAALVMEHTAQPE